MNYSAVTIKVNNANEDKMEVLVAILDSLNFEGITEEVDRATAYVLSSLYDRNILEVSLAGVKDTIHAEIVSEEPVEDKNWNEEWESNFEPVIVNHRCAIRAPFHEQFRNIEYVITISPKMAFGTGHHETTSLMISALLDLDVKDKSVLDMGCGTGVLGIFAKMRGAREVVCIDNDKWAYENTIENAKVNVVEVDAIHGSSDKIPHSDFDIILANINRNILIEQALDYSNALSAYGRIFLSGFLAEDVEMLEATFVDLGFTPVDHKSLGKWQLLEFVK